MNFVEPLYLAGLAAAALPVIVHLINRRKAVQQPFPALALLRESDKKEARSVKVRQWLLMALRVLAVALLAFALAKPFCLSDKAVGSGDRLPKSVVFVLDDTMSMHNADWWETARERIEDHLGRLKPWDQVALVTTTKLDGPVGRLENDQGRIRDALEDLSPSYETADIPKALMAASDILSTSELPNQRIVLVGDFTRGGFPSADGASEGFRYPVERVSVRDGGGSKNLAIEGVDYRQVGPAREGRWEISTTIRNYGSSDADRVEIRLKIDGKSVAGGLIDVPAGETTTHTIRHTAKGTGVRRGEVELVEADEMGVDNRRYFTFRMKKNVRVLLVNGAPSSVPYNDELYFAVPALNPGKESESSIVPELVTTDGFGGEELSEYDVVLMANVARVAGTTAEKLKTFVKNGGGLFIAVGNQIETDVYNQKLGELLPKPLRHVKRLAERDDPDAPVKVTRLGSSRRKHPVFRVFGLPGGTSLQSVSVYKYMLLEPSPPEQSKVILSYKDGAPALLERSRGSGRVFLLTTTIDRAWTDLPVRTAFLPLMRRSILYLARRATSEGSKKHTVGRRVALDVSGVVDNRAIIKGPKDLRHVLEPQEGTVAFKPQRPGAFEVWADDGKSESKSKNRLDGLAFSVNVATVESDLGALPESALEPWLDREKNGQKSGGTKARAAKKRVNIWPALLFAVTLALLLETLIGTRRSVLRKVWRRITFQPDPEVDV